MSESLRAGLADQINFASPYVGYLTTAWDRLHGLYSDPAEAFRKPEVERLFDGHHTAEQVFTGLPKTVRELLTAEFHQKLSNPDGARGARVSVVDAGPVDHGTVAKRSLPQVLRVFDSVA